MTTIATTATPWQTAPFVSWDQVPGDNRLFNREQFLDHLGRELGRTRKCLTARYDLLCIEPDCYWAMAMERGSASADRLTSAATDCIAELLSSQDAIASLGDGRIAVLLEVGGVPRSARDLVDDIQRRLMSGTVVNGRQVFTTASVGIARVSAKYISAGFILRDAGLALDRAITEGRARAARFSPLRDDHPANLLDLERDLHLALELDQFELHFQPMVCGETGQVDAFEALLRWNHPERGLQQPPEFLHALDDAGLAATVGEWVIRTAFTHAAEWRRTSGRTIPVTVNLSSTQMQSAVVTDSILRALDEGADPLSILIELGEDVFLHHRDAVNTALAPLRARGVRVVLDGFGTGLCCLGYIAQLPIDAVKLDVSLTDSVNRFAESQPMLRAVVEFAHGMDLDVIAGRIERADQLVEARQMSCDEVQGFLICGPVDALAASQLADNGWTGTLDLLSATELIAT